MATLTLSKSLAVLDLLIEHGALGLEELHLLSGLPKATLKRILDSLTELQWLYRRLGDQRYVFIRQTASRTEQAAIAPDLLRLLGQHLHALYQHTGLPSDIALACQGQLTVVESSFSLCGYRRASGQLIGLRPHPYISAIGRAYSAGQAPDDEAQRRHWRGLQRELARGFFLRRRGPWEHRVVPPFRVMGMAIPLRLQGGNQTVGAINLYWDNERHRCSHMVARFLPMLCASRGQIESSLPQGWR
ncbi:helix-turn-helix domain-containing protein [Pokkaliibacter plantistimulans]|uniref:helix-turn-helix domain-containing protein n=1 Tax=Pokkaliibacter plantistimulans TaxID=1635171 RepID=UPI0026B94626|nr:helix-turn-helix domain-containing protein [Pokkaliibacter plantistimulans]